VLVVKCLHLINSGLNASNKKQGRTLLPRKKRKKKWYLQPRQEKGKGSRTRAEEISDPSRTPSSSKREKSLSVTTVENKGTLQQTVGRRREKVSIMPPHQKRRKHQKKRLQHMSLRKITSLSPLSRALSLTMMCGWYTSVHLGI